METVIIITPKQWREEYTDYSQEALAEKLGVTQGLISKLESGKRQVTTDVLRGYMLLSNNIVTLESFDAIIP